jgi:hypothetical protein
MAGNSRKRLILTGAALAAVACAGAAYFLFGPLSPDAICARADTALGTRDAATLVALADPDELRKLALDVPKTQAILDSLYKQNPEGWRDAFSQPHRFERALLREPDIAFYATPRDRQHPGRTVSIAVNDSQRNGWRLNLSFLLSWACTITGSGHGKDIWRSVRTSYSIPGQRTVQGVYQFDDTQSRDPAGTSTAQH